MAIELIRSIRSSGGDYTSITAWDADFNPTTSTNLTTSLAFNYTNLTGSFVTGDNVTGGTSGATGEVVGSVVSGTLLIRNITGVFLTTETVSAVGGTLDLSDGGDLPIVIAECYNDWPSGLLDRIALSFISDQTAYPYIRGAVGHRADGILEQGFYLADLGLGPFLINQAYVPTGLYTRVEYIGMVGGWQTEVGDNSEFLSVWVKDSLGFTDIGINSSLTNCWGENLDFGFTALTIATNSSLYNCGVIDCNAGFTAQSFTTTDILVVNCYGTGSTVTDFAGTFSNPANSNNLSSDASAPGTASIINAAPSFVNALIGDYHLNWDDTVAQGNGIDLSSAALHPFNTDFDGDLRVDWSIGPDDLVVLPSESIGSGGAILTDVTTGSGTMWMSVEGTGSYNLTGDITGSGVVNVNKSVGSGSSIVSGAGNTLFPVFGSGSGNIVGDGLGGTLLDSNVTGGGSGQTDIIGSGGTILEGLIPGYVTGIGGLKLRSNVFGDHAIQYENLNNLHSITDNSTDDSSFISYTIDPYVTDDIYFAGIFIKKSLISFNSLLRMSFTGSGTSKAHDLEINAFTGNFSTSTFTLGSVFTVTDIGDYYFVWMEAKSDDVGHDRLTLEFYPAYGNVFGVNDINLTGGVTCWGLTLSPVNNTLYNSKVESGCFKCSELITSDYLLTDNLGNYIVDNNDDNILVTKRIRDTSNGATLLGEYNRTVRGHPFTEVL